MQPKYRRVLWPDMTTAQLPPPWSTDDKIRIFRNQVGMWQLDVAYGLMRSNEHAGFAVLSIITSYFEMIWQYMTGKSSRNCSERAFVEGVIWVFEDEWQWTTLEVGEQERIRSSLSALYKDLRCGLYHSGMTRDRVAINGDFPSLYCTPEGTWKTSPLKLIGKLREHLDTYTRWLQTDVDLRKRFEKQFDEDQRV